MRLKELIKSIKDCCLRPYAGSDFSVSGISSNSKGIKPGFVFVAIKGAKADGNKFIGEAIINGARAVVVQSQKSPLGFARGRKVKSQKGVSLIIVRDTRKALGRLAAAFYGDPSAKIKVAAVTGTNGKTTITYLIEALLKEAGSEPAVIGTINYRFKDKIIPSKNTTPGPLELQAMLADMLKEKVDYAVMEVSSHALAQARIEGVKIHSAIFTNLTQDHLDYHTSLENYFRAKSMLFRDISSGALAVINQDDKYAPRLKSLTQARIITYAIDSAADVRAVGIKMHMAHTEFTVVAAGRRTKIKTSLIGRHNIYNLLAVFAWGLASGIKLSVIKSGLEKFSLVPGRLEKVGPANIPFSVFVDYAHTQDALENVIKSLRPLSKNRLIVVFGCGGERDKTKRPKMGRVVSRLADYAIITNDNPRSEDPQKIINEIKKGIKKNNYSVIPERIAAIRKSLEMAGRGDIVLVAGKGHEDYQILKDKTIHFDDREAVRECLRSMNC